MSEDSDKKPAAQSGVNFDFNTMIYNLWNGKLPLMQVFWLYYFAAVVVMTALGSIIGFLATVFGLMKMVWAGFMVKPIWVAAEQYKGPQHWALLAKVAAVLIAIAAVGDFFAF